MSYYCHMPTKGHVRYSEELKERNIGLCVTVSFSTDLEYKISARYTHVLMINRPQKLQAAVSYFSRKTRRPREKNPPLTFRVASVSYIGVVVFTASASRYDACMQLSRIWWQMWFGRFATDTIRSALFACPRMLRHINDVDAVSSMLDRRRCSPYQAHHENSHAELISHNKYPIASRRSIIPNVAMYLSLGMNSSNVHGVYRCWSLIIWSML